MPLLAAAVPAGASPAAAALAALPLAVLFLATGFFPAAFSAPFLAGAFSSTASLAGIFSSAAFLAGVSSWPAFLAVTFTSELSAEPFDTAASDTAPPPTLPRTLLTGFPSRASAAPARALFFPPTFLAAPPEAPAWVDLLDADCCTAVFFATMPRPLHIL